MKSSVGRIDRVARIGVGVVLILYGYFAKEPMAYVGLLPLAAGLVGFCPCTKFLRLPNIKKD